MVADHSSIYLDVRRALAEAGVELVDYAAIPEHHEALRQRFFDEIFPVLTPLAVDPGHPFPYISTLSLSIAVGLRDPETGERGFARVKVPEILPRLLEVEPSRFVLIDQVIEANLDALFTGMEIVEHHLFRVTRNADLALEEDEADDLLMAIEEELRRRRFGEAVRVEVERSMPAGTRVAPAARPGPERGRCLRGQRHAGPDRPPPDRSTSPGPDLQVPAWTPVTPPRLLPPDEDVPADTFAAIRAGDILVHHPYESFAASVERFITQAADDPDVLSIKQTLYRTSGDSPIVQSLIRAAERGKQVVVLVEIKARFDEEANIVWARKLERAGAHVVYGLVGLKTHSKTALVVRREGSGLRRYVHIGTGNYNPKTARLYVDLGLLTVRPGDRRGRDGPVQRPDRPVPPADVPSAARRAAQPSVAVPRARRAGGRPRPGRPPRAHRRSSSTRSSTSPSIEALYRASQAGVQIDLIIRAGCSLQPGIAGRLREHPRPLDHRRVPRALAHLVVRERRRPRVVHRVGRPDGPQPRPARRGDRPGRGPRRADPLAKIIDVMLADDRRSWQLQPDATWVRTEVLDRGRRAPSTRSRCSRAIALAQGHVADIPRRPGAGRRLAGPRA